MPKSAHKIGTLLPILLLYMSFERLHSGSLLFCPDCGTLLDLPEADADSVTCEQCGFVEPASCE